MTGRPLALALICVLGLTSIASANDGWSGLSSTGLQFEKSDAVQMVRERLFVSPARVRVAYAFRNRESKVQFQSPGPPLSSTPGNSP